MPFVEAFALLNFATASMGGARRGGGQAPRVTVITYLLYQGRHIPEFTHVHRDNSGVTYCIESGGREWKVYLFSDN
jgi:hypothetical protein